MYNSFNARVPVLRFPLDHIFHSEHFRLVRLERLGKFGSDHFPLFIELSYQDDVARKLRSRADTSRSGVATLDRTVAWKTRSGVDPESVLLLSRLFVLLTIMRPPAWTVS